MYVKNLMQVGSAHVLFLVTCTALSGPRCPGYSSPAAGLPNVASTWAGDAQVCWQNTLCIPSLTLKGLPKLSHGANCSREPRIFLTYTGEAVKGEIVTSPLNS